LRANTLWRYARRNWWWSGRHEAAQRAGGVAMTMEVAAGAPGYPARLDIQYPAELNRWLPLIKWLLAIPHLLILYALVSVAGIITFVAIFAILFTKKYPRELFDFVVNIFRWQQNVNAYILLMRDEYPPFSWEPNKYPVTFEVDYPEDLNRWLPLVKWLLALPHYIILVFLWIAAYFAILIAFFAILFTKKFPESFFQFVVGTQRWGMRVTAYTYLLRDEYPPFSLDP
jgi:hypothetical protein